jgi:predicted dehydrogenase
MGKTHHPLRTVVVGGGHFGTKRIQSCLKLQGDFIIVGVIEPSKERAQEIINTYKLPVFSSFHALNVTADLAIIATPNAFHADSCINALSLGMHVLCEKPLAPTFIEAMRIVDASIKYHRFVKTGSNHRFIPFIEKTVSLVKENAIGHVLRINGSIGNNGEHVAGGWFWDKKLSGGGTLIDNGCHLIDIVTYLLYEISTCTAQTSINYWKKASVEDNASVLLQTGNGQLATITSSWTKWNGYLSLEVWGSEGYIITNSDTQIVVYGNKQGKILKTYDFTNDKTVSYQKELLYFKNCIEKGVSPEPDAQDGARVVRIIEAAYKASRLKKQIFLITK